MKMQTVAVLGAGAVGSYVIWGLAGKPGIRLGVLAEGERAARLKANGIGINGRTYRPEVWAPEEAHGVDFLVVCLKYGALPGAMDSIRKAVGEHTVVMSLMNGVDSEERIAAEVGDAHVIRSLIKVASHKEADGFHFDPDATLGIIFGEQEAPFQSERVQAIVELFEGSGIHYRVTEHIREEMWAKFRLNVCNNLPQAILGAGVGCYRDSVHMQAISDGLRRELEAIAAAKGIDLRIADAAAGRGSAVPPTARYSTLQDLDAGRHTEIDMFSGALMRMGAELGIPTPYNEYTYHMIKALEEKNDGRFDYTAAKRSPGQNNADSKPPSLHRQGWGFVSFNRGRACACGSWAGTAAEVQHGGQTAGNVFLGPLDRGVEVIAFGQIGGDGAGQGAAGAVGVGVVDALPTEPLPAAVPPEQVVGIVDLVPALAEDGTAVLLADLPGGGFHPGGVGDD